MDGRRPRAKSCLVVLLVEDLIYAQRETRGRGSGPGGGGRRSSEWWYSVRPRGRIGQAQDRAEQSRRGGRVLSEERGARSERGLRCSAVQEQESERKANARE